MPRKRRPPPFSYRPTIAERDRVVAEWTASGLSFSAFVTEAILRRPARRARRKAAVEEQSCSRVLWHAGRIGDHLQALGPILGEDEFARFERAYQAELCAIRTLMMEALGRER